MNKKKADELDTTEYVFDNIPGWTVGEDYSGATVLHVEHRPEGV